MLLLSAIALFSPDSPNVVHRDVVKLEQVSAVCILIKVQTRGGCVVWVGQLISFNELIFRGLKPLFLKN